MSWEKATAGLLILTNGIESEWRQEKMTPTALQKEIDVLFERISRVMDCIVEPYKSSYVAERMQFFEGERDKIITRLPSLQHEAVKLQVHYDILHSIKNIRRGLTVLMKEKAPLYSRHAEKELEAVFYESIRPRLASESK